MGLMVREKQTISVTDVRNILIGEHRHEWDLGKADFGRKQHKLILNAIDVQVSPTLTGFLDNTGTALPISEGTILSRERELMLRVDQELSLKLRPDMIMGSGNDLSCIEIKNNYVVTDLLQLMYGCMAADKHFTGSLAQGFLYLYQGGNSHQVLTLKDGGRRHWEDGLVIAKLAAQIRSTTKKESRNISEIVMINEDIPTSNPNEQAIIMRGQLDSVWGSVSRGLVGLLN